MMRLWRWTGLVMALMVLAGCGGGATPMVDPTPGGGGNSTPEPAATSLPEATVVPTPPSTPTGARATVVDLINRVDAHPLPEQDWAPAEVDMTVYLGGEVWAQEASTARLAVDQGRVRVAPNTIFTFGQSDPDTMQVDLDEGQIWLDIDGLGAGDSFEVETPAAVASVRGTRFSVRTEADGETLVSTQASTVTVLAAGEMVTVTAGLQTVIRPGEVPGPPMPMSLDERVRWGMATSANLDVLLPAAGVSDVFTYTGWSSYWDWTPNGDMLGVVYYDETDDGYNNTFYTPEGGAVTMTLPFEAGGFSYNPTGEGMVYLQYNRTEFTTQICTADNDGSNPSCWGDDTHHMEPEWSPDGQWLAFPGAADRGQQIFTARPDGSDLTQLTADVGQNNTCVAWSSDGASLAYVHSVTWDAPHEVWVMDADGSGPQMVYDDAWWHPCPAWSPDDAWLAMPGFNGGLTLIRPDGSETSVVPGTANSACREPVWSPTSDGWPLFFQTVDDQGQQQLWYVTGEGEEPVYFADGWGPIWSGDGSRVAFGLTDLTGRNPVTQIHVFQAIPEFWP